MTIAALTARAHMPRKLLLIAGLSCSAGLLFDTPQKRLIAAVVGASMPIAADWVVKLVQIAFVKARRRNWRQYNLRGLLMWVTFCAIALMVYDRWLRPDREQRQLIAAVNRLGGSADSNPDELTLSLVGISDDELATLATMPGRLKVTQIGLRGSITDHGVVQLKQFPRLEVVDLSQCPITDEGAKRLQALPKLRGLHLDGCSNVTNAGIAWLANRREMRAVNVMNTGVTTAEMEELAKALPHCAVFRNRP